MRVSFLISVHNEEKLIGRVLQHLLHLPYPNYEVLVGLDGCTDRTLKVVRSYARSSKRCRYFAYAERRGKPAVIDSLVAHANGEIIVIHDADWLFHYGDSEALRNFFSVFSDSSIGGIAESFPVEWTAAGMRRGNLGYRMVAYSSYLWFSFQKERYTKPYDGYAVVTDPTFMLTNVFRKSLYRPQFSLGDDFERTYYIMQQGYNVAVFPSLDAPRMIATYSKIRILDILRQKTRTAIARQQLRSHLILRPSIFSYYLPLSVFFLTRSLRMGAHVFLSILFWLCLFFLGAVLSRFHVSDTRRQWMMRARR